MKDSFAEQGGLRGPFWADGLAVAHVKQPLATIPIVAESDRPLRLLRDHSLSGVCWATNPGHALISSSDWHKRRIGCHGPLFFRGSRPVCDPRETPWKLAHQDDNHTAFPEDLTVSQSVRNESIAPTRGWRFPPA